MNQTLRHADKTHIIFDGKTYLFFGGYDYYNLSFHPKVRNAFSSGIEKFGLNSGGSRATTGNHSVHVDVEKKLSGFLNTESTLLMPTGYLSNIALFKDGLKDADVFIVSDVIHPSIQDGLILSSRPI